MRPHPLVTLERPGDLGDRPVLEEDVAPAGWVSGSPESLPSPGSPSRAQPTGPKNPMLSFLAQYRWAYRASSPAR